MDSNLIMILVLILIVGIGFYAYIQALKKTDDDLVYTSEFEIDSLIAKVKEIFAATQKANLLDQNLTKAEYDKEKRKKKRLTDALKASSYGDTNAKKYIKDSIKEILIDPKGCNITPENVNKVISFDDVTSLTMQDKADIIFHFYFKKDGTKGFRAFMKENGFYKPRNITRKEEEDEGFIRYDITKEDFNECFVKLYAEKIRLSYDDKIEIIAQRIFAKYKGFGAIDKLTEFSVDEIDCGNSGIMEGAYQLRDVNGKLPYTYESVYVVFTGLNIRLSFLSFENNEELIRVCQNVYKCQTPYALSKRKAHVVGTMMDGSRIAVTRPPENNTWAFWMRKFDTSVASSPEKLLYYDEKPEKGADKVLTLTRWIIRTCRSMMVTGGMGTGKTTWLKAICRYIPTLKNIRVFEISPELNLQFTYPNRNITNFAVTQSTDMQSLYDFGKKSNSQINIVGEVASAEQGVIFLQSATVGSEMALGTHHAKTAEDLVLSIRDNLTSAGGYNNEEVAEEVVAKALNFNTHMTREKDHRYIERITEIVPIRDRSYPGDHGTFSDNDKFEFYKRVTDRRSFTTVNIIEYRNGEYVVANRLSNEIMKQMRDYLPADEIEEFDKDMEWLFKNLSVTAN